MEIKKDLGLFDGSDLSPSVEEKKRKRVQHLHQYKGIGEDELLLPGLFDSEDTVYLESISNITPECFDFFDNYGLQSVSDLISFIEGQGRENLGSIIGATPDTILRIIKEYNNEPNGECVIKRDIAPFGFDIREKTPSPSLLAFPLGKECRNALFSLGVFTVSSLLYVEKHYSLETIKGLDTSLVKEIKNLCGKEKGKWETKDVEIRELEEGEVRGDYELSRSRRGACLIFDLPQALWNKLYSLGIEISGDLYEYVTRKNIYSDLNFTSEDIETISSYLSDNPYSFFSSHFRLDQFCKRLESYIAGNISARDLFVYIKRGEGISLEAIAKDMGISKERVRQIQLKTLETLSPFSSYLLDKEFEDKECIKEECILDRFCDKDIGLAIIYSMKYVPKIEYYDTFKLFIKEKVPAGRERLRSIVEEVVGEEMDLDLCMTLFYEALGNDWRVIGKEDMLRFLSEEGYFVYNKFVTKRKMNHRALALKVIYKYFPDGISLTQVNSVVSEDMDRLRILVEREFNITLKLSNKHLYERLTGENDLVLIDKSTFIHSSHIVIEEKTLDEIKEKIEELPLRKISFRYLFENLSGVLENTRINNQYALHGVIQHYLWSLYRITRDYLIKKE